MPSRNCSPKNNDLLLKRLRRHAKDSRSLIFAVSPALQSYLIALVLWYVDEREAKTHPPFADLWTEVVTDRPELREIFPTAKTFKFWLLDRI